MKIEIDLSPQQVKAIGTFADEFRLTMPEAVLALAIMAMSTIHDVGDMPYFVRDAMEAVDNGDWSASEMDGRVFDLLEIQDGPFRAFCRSSHLQAVARQLEGSRG